MWLVPDCELDHVIDANDCSGIFGYINYLVEKDRKFIVDTLVNGMSSREKRMR